MQMLYPFGGSIQQYVTGVELKEEANRCRPAACPQCESEQPLVCHGFYRRTVVDVDSDWVIRVRRYLCSKCRRTVSLLPDLVLPYMRFATEVIAVFLTARLWRGETLKTAAETAGQTGMPYQRGQQWIRRFRHEAESISAALAALVRPMTAADFVQKAIQMLEETGWIRAHRFLFGELRQHLLGWPEFLASAGTAVRIGKATAATDESPQSTCMDSESPSA
jgi:hypothetical protein